MKNKILVLFAQEWDFAELGSHRYATLNLGGENRHDLEQRYRAVCREFALEVH